LWPLVFLHELDGVGKGSVQKKKTLVGQLHLSKGDARFWSFFGACIWFHHLWHWQKVSYSGSKLSTDVRTQHGGNGPLVLDPCFGAGILPIRLSFEMISNYA
jgi:hypothetical protein